MVIRRRLETAAFAVAVAMFCGSSLVAFAYAVIVERRLPGISLDYLAEADASFRAGHFEAAAARYRATATIARDDDRALYRLGLALQEMGDLPAAARAYRRSLRLEPANKETHYNLALVLIEQGAYEEAIRHNRTALQIDPEYVEAHANLGAALMYQGHLDDARKHYLAAARLRPGFPPAVKALVVLGGTEKGTPRGDH
jgi:tetratricopeptide (TPR) repeat protein